MVANLRLLLIRVGLPLITLLLVFSVIDVRSLVPVLVELPPLGIIFIILVSITRPLIGGWRVMVACSKFTPIPLMVGTKGYYLAAYGSFFLPSAVGGDLLRIEHLSKSSGMGRTTCLVIIGCERTVGLIAQILSLFILLAMTQGEVISEVAPHLGMVLIAILISMLILWQTPRIPFFRSFFKTITSSLLELKSARLLGRMTLISILLLISIAVVPVSVALVIDGPAAAAGIAVITIIIGLITTLPFPSGGIGVREASYAALSPLFGIPSELGVMCGLSLSLSVFLCGIPGFFLQNELFFEGTASEQE